MLNSCRNKTEGAHRHGDGGEEAALCPRVCVLFRGEGERRKINIYIYWRKTDKNIKYTFKEINRKRDRLPETLGVVQVPIDTRGEQYPHHQFRVFLHRCYAVKSHLTHVVVGNEASGGAEGSLFILAVVSG